MSSPRPFSNSDELRWQKLQRKTQEVRVLQAFSLFRQHSIEPILIKGWAVGRFYPEDSPRACIDIDIAVGSTDYNRAFELIRSSEAEGLAIDLHRELRHLDTVKWDDLFANSREIQLDGETVRVLRDEDHLRVLCVHWLTDGGTNRDRLRDIYYMVENRSPDFDWSRFLDVVSHERRRWLVCTVGLAKCYLGLDLRGTPIEREADNLPRWLIATVEREWSNEQKDKPIEDSMHDRRLFFEQLKRRFQPNPIRATVEMEGRFDARTRVFYSLSNSLRRIPPTVQRVINRLRSRLG